MGCCVLDRLHPGVDGVDVVILVVIELLCQSLELSDAVVLSLNVALEGLVDLLQCLWGRERGRHVGRAQWGREGERETCMVQWWRGGEGETCRAQWWREGEGGRHVGHSGGERERGRHAWYSGGRGGHGLS